MPTTIRKGKITSAAEWREQYEELEQDQAEHASDQPDADGDDSSTIPAAQVNMSQLLSHAKIKEEKLRSGYDFIGSPASKVVVAEDKKGRYVGETEDEDWVDLKEPDDPERKDYSCAVKGTKPGLVQQVEA